MSTDVNMSTICQAQISKIIQSGGFLGSLLSKLAGPLMKVAIPLAKNVLAPLGITAAASAIDAGIQKKIHGSGTTTLIISNEEMNDIMKIVQVLQDSNILLKGVTRTIKNETKEQKGELLSMLLGTLGASLLGNLLAGKGIVKAGSGNKKGKGIRHMDGAYVINLDEYADVGTHWIALFFNGSQIVFLIGLVLSMFLKKLNSLLGK